MRKTERELEKKFGGFVPPGVVKGQSARRRPETIPEPAVEPTPEPEPVAEPEPADKGDKR